MMRLLLGALFTVLLPHLITAQTPECRSELDMCIVIDTSDTVIQTFDRLGFLKLGLSNFLNLFDIGPGANQDQLGVCIYGDNSVNPPSRAVVTLGVNQDVTLIRSAIGTFPEFGVNSGFEPVTGSANIGAGLDCCREMLANNGRPDNRDIVVLVTLANADTPANMAAVGPAATEVKQSAHLSTFTIGPLFIDRNLILDLATDATSRTIIDDYQPWVDESLNPTSSLRSFCPDALMPPPNPCDGCKWRNGIGYAAAENCWEYYECDSVTLQPILRKTAFGTFWDNNILSLRQPGPLWLCPNDACQTLPLGAVYGRSDNCRIYMQCNADFGITESINCCPDGQGFNGFACVDDPSCMDNCTVQLEEQPCTLIPVAGNPRVYNQTVTGDIMPCPGGTIFDPSECVCIDDPIQRLVVNAAGSVCIPEFHLDFSNGRIEDQSKNNYYIKNSGVTVRQLPNGEYVGVFGEGTSDLRVFGFANNDFQQQLAIYVRARPTQAQSNAALVSNSDCIEDRETYALLLTSLLAEQSLIRSFALTAQPGGPVITNPVETTVPGFRTIIYEYDGSQVTTWVDGDFTEQSGGPFLQIQQPSCPMIIGDGLSFGKFVGEISEVRVYSCKRPFTEDYLQV